MVPAKNSEADLIHQERTRVLAEIHTVQEDLNDVEQRLEKNRPDFGLGRGGSQIYEWEMNLARRDSLRKKLERLREALERIDAGQYGICIHCGQLISPERLALLPSTKLCAKCARELEEQRHGRRRRR